LKRTVNPVAPNLPTQWLDWATSHQPNAHIGKSHLGSVGDMRSEHQGFDDSVDMRGTLNLPEQHPPVSRG